MLRKLLAVVALIRPELPLSAGICVVLGQALALGGLPPLRSGALGFALGFLLSSSAMAFNDFFDRQVDRVNAPNRPIPSGRVSPREAVATGAFCGLAALAVALAIHPLVFALALVGWLLGLLYNARLKAAGIWGNLIVSLNVAMTFFIGGISAGQAANPLVWIFGLIAGTFDLAEEIAGDAMDMEGDRQRASRSIALVHGRAAALRLSTLLFGVVILLTALPPLLGETSLGYLIPIASMDLLIVYCTSRLVQSQTRAEGHRWMRRLYLSATLGLVAFFLARFLGPG